MPATPAWGGRDKRIPGTYWPASLAKLASSRFSEKPCLKTTVGSDWGRRLLLHSVHTCTGAHTCMHPMNNYTLTHRIATGMFSSFAWTLPYPLNSMYAPKLGPVWKVSCFLADLGVANLNSSWYFQYVTVKVQDVTAPRPKVPVWNADMCAHQK